MVFRRSRFSLEAGGRTFRLGSETKIMAVLNVTPDSFSDGGSFIDPAAALAQALKMEGEGAHILDIGGESSRPGATPVSAKEEIRRILPVIKKLSKKIKIPISVDTTKFEVAHAALDAGAVIVNDIRALKNNRKLAKLIARAKAGVVLMHMRGTPRTMQKRLGTGDVVVEICGFLRRAIEFALENGITRSNIVVDPGFGFGKTTEQNLKILGDLEIFSSLQTPVLVGLSRKSFIGNVLGEPVEKRLTGSLAAAALAILRGAHILRVHDVLPHRQLTAIIDGAMAQTQA